MKYIELHGVLTFLFQDINQLVFEISTVAIVYVTHGYRTRIWLETSRITVLT